MINEDVLTPHYQTIADLLSEIIPSEDWDKIAMYAEECGNVGSVSFYFYIENQVYHWSDIPEKYSVSEAVLDEFMDELMALNKQLWQEFKNAEEQPWQSFSFYLNSDWSFKTQYEYERDNEVDTFEREIRWVYEKLGIIPDDDYAKKLLNEYLEKKGLDKVQ